MRTLVTEKSIGVEGKTGSIEVGKRADLLLLKGDPRDDLSLISVDGYLHRP